MIGIGIDIGSTAAKAAVVDGEGSVAWTCVQQPGFPRSMLPSGCASTGSGWLWRGCRRRARDRDWLRPCCRALCAQGRDRDYLPRHRCRASVWRSRTVIDVGARTPRSSSLKAAAWPSLTMNDKCAAGTGRFLEIMADRLGISQQQMADLARSGEPSKISSMCTVFAESEVISLIGRGEPRENIARGVIDSVVSRVATMAGQAAGARTT